MKHFKRSIAGWVGASVAAAVLAGSGGEAHADSCGDFGGIGVALGAMIGGGTAVVSSFAMPGIAVAAESSGNLNYWPGVGWTFLGASTGVGAGTFLSAAALCEAGPYLPALNGLGIGVISTVVWASVTPTEPEPSPLPTQGPQLGVVPIGDDGAAAVLSVAF